MRYTRLHGLKPMQSSHDIIRLSYLEFLPYSEFPYNKLRYSLKFGATLQILTLLMPFRKITHISRLFNVPNDNFLIHTPKSYSISNIHIPPHFVIPLEVSEYHRKYQTRINTHRITHRIYGKYGEI